MAFRPDPDLYSRSLRELQDYACHLEHMIQAGPTEIEAVANLRQELGLSKSEAEILVIMSDGRTHPKEGILLRLRGGSDDLPEPKSIDVYVSKIRKKLAGTGIAISTLWGSGYFIKDTERLLAAMGGEPLARGEDAPPIEVGRPVGGHGAGHGEIRDRALAFFEANAVGGVVEVSAREMARNVASSTGGATILRNLERSGHIEILRKPHRGGLWKLRVLKEDFA